MNLRQFFTVAVVALLGQGSNAAGQPSPQSIILVSTTSVENSGLLAHILPVCTKEAGITVHVSWPKERGRRFRQRRATNSTCRSRMPALQPISTRPRCP